VYLSVASIWELAIKTGNRKLVLNEPLDVYIDKWSTTYRLALLPIGKAHTLIVATLPDHHRDPFDRILVAQALVEGMTLVSADPKITAYTAPILW